MLCYYVSIFVNVNVFLILRLFTNPLSSNVSSVLLGPGEDEVDLEN